MRLSEIKAISPAGAHQTEHLTPPKSLQRGHRIQARRKCSSSRYKQADHAIRAFGALRRLCFLLVQNSLTHEELYKHKFTMLVLQENMDFFAAAAAALEHSD